MKNKVLLLLKRGVDDDILNVSNPRMPLQISISKSTIKVLIVFVVC